MESVTVLDSPCGEGKTTWCIDYMKKNIGNDKFIYVTPFIDEITRVRNEINGVGDNKDLKLYEPNLINSTKYNDFVRLLGEQRNIAMTHSLFSMSGEDVVKYIENGEYTLILDEVMDVVTQIPVKKGDISVMIDAKLIKIEENGLIKTERTNGKFVTEDENIINKIKNDYADNLTQNYLFEMISLGITKQEIKERIK